MKPLNVLSLCDGISGLQIALKEAGIPIDTYYASEIDKKALEITMTNFPNTIQLGDVNNITEENIKNMPKINLISWGSPCRSLTMATAGRPEYNNGLKGVSGLFFACYKVFQWVKKYNNPNVNFLMENVDNKGKQEDLDIISTYLGVEPHLIDSAIFSAQTRKRNYWTNIPIDDLPNASPLILEDILDKNVVEKYYYKEDFDYYGNDKIVCGTLHINGHDIIKRINSTKHKCQTLTACRGGNHQKKVIENGKCRKLTPNEYRKLQGIPDWFIMNTSDTVIYNTMGDGFNIPTIVFLLKNLNKED